MIATAGKTLRDGSHESYASEHAGRSGGEASALIYRRDIRPLLRPPSAGPVAGIVCGQGDLVRLLLADRYGAHGIDVSPEQVVIAHAAGLDRVSQGDYRDMLAGRRGESAAVTALDLPEHLTKDEVLDTFDRVTMALIPGGRFAARMPNAVSRWAAMSGTGLHARVFIHRQERQAACDSGGLQRRCRSVLPSRSAWPDERSPCGGLGTGQRYVQDRAGRRNGTIRGHVVTRNLTFVASKAGY